jgi:hypothetical protein
MRYPHGACVVAAFAAMLIVSSAHGGLIIYDATLSGPAESPPNASPGIGFAEVDINTTANTMRVQISFSGLLGPTTASHIHSATPSPGAGTAIVATTTPTFPVFPLGVTSGTYDQTLDMTLASSYNPAFITANGGTTASAESALFAGIAADEAYVNIHTTIVPGGEIRGFLVPVPDPASIGVIGCAGLLTLRRSRSPARHVQGAVL